MSDIERHLLWRYLPVVDIISNCQINTAFQQICNDPETWKYLLYRDYTVDSHTDNPRQEYMNERRRSTMLSNPKYKGIIARINSWMNRSILDNKAINIISGNIVNSIASQYYIRRYNVDSIDRSINRDISFAFKNTMNKVDENVYIDILRTVFHAQ